MTQDEIIRMAREAGKTKWYGTHPDGTNDFLGAEFTPEQLERFAAIVAENTGIEQQREIVRLKGIIEEQANGAQNLVLEEREACAKVCDKAAVYDGYIAANCAAAIRARGEK